MTREVYIKIFLDAKDLMDITEEQRTHIAHDIKTSLGMIGFSPRGIFIPKIYNLEKR